MFVVGTAAEKLLSERKILSTLLHFRIENNAIFLIYEIL